MSEQYFTQSPSSQHDEQLIEEMIGSHNFCFKTDRGVFSKERVDFGSRFLVETFIENYEGTQQSKILELGSGYGPIIISIASHLPSVEAYGIEVNERAYLLSRENAQLNKVSNLKLFHGDARDIKEYLVETMDIVITNPPIRAGKQVIQSFVQEAYGLLETNGELWLVIAKKQGAPSMRSYMDEIFGNVERVGMSKGYWLLKSRKTFE